MKVGAPLLRVAFLLEFLQEVQRFEPVGYDSLGVLFDFLKG